MDVERTIAISGDAKKAVEFAFNILVAADFEIIRQSDDGFEMKGPGMWSSNQNPLAGISRVVVESGAGKIIFRADLGGIKKFRDKFIWGVGGLTLLTLVVLALFFKDDTHFNIKLPFVLLLPWLVIIPIILKVTKIRTLGTIETLLKNMSAVR